MGAYVFDGCNNLVIFTEFLAEPDTWGYAWNFLNRPVYWSGEWHYDDNGNPVPNN